MNKTLYRLVFFGLCLFTASYAPARPSAPFFSTLSMRDGLPSNIIVAIAEDKYGFLWIGTGSGLARYNGYAFKTFKRGESQNSLPSNELNTVISDGEYIWVGTWGGLCKVNITTFEVTRVDLGGVTTIRSLFKGKDDNLWIGTSNGLIRYSLADNSYKVFNSENSGLSHDMVRTIFEDGRGNLWVGTYDKLNKLVGDRFMPLDLKGNYRPGLKNHLVLDIKPAAGKDSSIWVGTETGLYKLNTYTHRFKHFGEQNTSLSNEVVKCIHTDSDQTLWLGTDFGLNEFNADTKENNVHFHNPQLAYSIANNVIWQIFEDSGGVLWFVTSNGLSRINKHGNFYEFHEISHPVRSQPIGNQVRSILVASNGIYWLATQHGVIRLDPRSGSRKVFDANSPANERILLNNVFALEEDAYGRIWIGTAGGINIWDEAQSKMQSVSASGKNGLTSNYIGKFTKAPDGSLWVSAWEGGLYKIQGDLKKPQSIRFNKFPSIQSGTEKHVAGEDCIWVIEYDELYRIDLKTLQKSHIPNFSKASAHQMIFSLYYSSSGKLWAGAQNGLVEYSPDDNTVLFHELQNANDASFSSLTEDNDGNIWSATNIALQKLNIATLQFETYPLEKNIPLKSFFYGCTARTAAGDILFGGDNGYIDFRPATVEPNLFQAPVYITSIEINNKNIGIHDEVDGEVLLTRDISFTKKLELSYQEHSVTFEFSSLHFWEPSMNTFAYKLENFDKDFIYVSGSKNFAVYSNLPPGSYVFKVRGTNNNGVPSSHVASLALTISPPIFLRTDFIIAYILIAAALIYYALKAYSTRVHLNNELKIIRMEKKHAEEIEHTKEEFFTNISHELRTPISLILPPIHELQKKGNLDKESSQLISLAEKNSHRLLRLVNQILDFNKLENSTLQVRLTRMEIIGFSQGVFSLFNDQAHRNKIDFRFTSDIHEAFIWIDHEKYETILFNLLSNAFKFTPPGGSISVSAQIQKEVHGSSFEITVRDSGIGIHAQDQPRIFDRFFQSSEGKKRGSGSGIGLTLAYEYVNLHHGTISVQSEPGRGASFTVRLPAGTDHLPVNPNNNHEPINLVVKKWTHPPAEGTRSYQLGLESTKPLVLIIEDNPDIIEFIRISLSSRYNFLLAENGEEGYSKACNFVPEVIISDIMMPVMDGLTLCRKVKENNRTSHISVILLTARDLNAHKVEGIRMGADVYLTKPFEIDLLEAHIDHLIERKKELVNYFRSELISLPKGSDVNDSEDTRFIKQVMNIIEASLPNPDFGVDNISQAIGISTTHLYRKLKALTNNSANDIIRKYRLKKASLLLKNKEGNISEIMYEVGFSSLSYFSKCFKAEFGISPKEFQQRESHRTYEIRPEEGLQIKD
jgi:signal transduction histidine kinase/ligand-binding sensor domain-containing protein/AraC-like DNA-binding protein/ActR/RegA family two-component response regulator